MKINGVSRRFQAFPGVSRRFQAFPGKIDRSCARSCRLLGALMLLLPFALMAQSSGQIEGLTESEDYKLIAQPGSFAPLNGKIEVVEVLMGGCPPCDNFEKMSANWAQQQSDDIRLLYLPTFIKNIEWSTRAYFAAEQLGVVEQNGRMTELNQLWSYLMNNPNDSGNLKNYLSFFKGKGTSTANLRVPYEQYEETIQSAEVGEKAEATHAFLKRAKIMTVPALVINGKYVVSAGNGKDFEDLLRIADVLIAHERKQVAASSLPLLPMALLAIILAVPASFWLKRRRHKTPLRKSDQ